MIYQWKSASRIKTNAQTAGEICENLERTVGLTAKNLLEVSRPEDAPLHNEFEWNDSVAAEKYRENQARYIIRMLCVAPEKEDKPPVRAFSRSHQSSHMKTSSASWLIPKSAHRCSKWRLQSSRHSRRNTPLFQNLNLCLLRSSR